MRHNTLIALLEKLDEIHVTYKLMKSDYSDNTKLVII